MIEFPKALYRGDEFVTVEGPDDEAKARADGFRFWSDPDEAEDAADGAVDQPPGEPVKRGPGRPKKVQ